MTPWGLWSGQTNNKTTALIISIVLYLLVSCCLTPVSAAGCQAKENCTMMEEGSLDCSICTTAESVKKCT